MQYSFTVVNKLVADVVALANLPSEEHQGARQAGKSVEKPAEFWGEIAAQFHWQTPPSADKFLEYNFDVNKVRVESTWFKV